jgi:hypothetical protein
VEQQLFNEDLISQWCKDNANVRLAVDDHSTECRMISFSNGVITLASNEGHDTFTLPASYRHVPNAPMLAMLLDDDLDAVMLCWGAFLPH